MGIKIVGLTALMASLVAAILTKSLLVGAGVLLLGIVYNLGTYVCIIPVLGFAIWWTAMGILTPRIIVFVNIPPEVYWITSGLYWIYFCMALLITIIYSFAAIVKIFPKFKFKFTFRRNL